MGDASPNIVLIDRAFPFVMGPMVGEHCAARVMLATSGPDVTALKWIYKNINYKLSKYGYFYQSMKQGTIKMTKLT